MLLGDFFAVLVFQLDTAERFQLGEGGGKLRRGNPQRGLDGAGRALRRAGAEIRGIAMVASENSVERDARRIEIFRNDRERDGACDHWLGKNSAGNGIAASFLKLYTTRRQLALAFFEDEI